MTDLQKSLLRELEQIENTDVLNLCLDGAQARTNRSNVDEKYTNDSYEFFTRVDILHDIAYIKMESTKDGNLYQRVIRTLDLWWTKKRWVF